VNFVYFVVKITGGVGDGGGRPYNQMEERYFHHEGHEGHEEEIFGIKK
jgi:hypothetical protein